MKLPQKHIKQLLPFFLILLKTATAQPVSFHYEVSMADRDHHNYQLTCTATGQTSPVVDFKMPVWMPGYYQLLDYADAVARFSAYDKNGHPLPWEKTNKNTWRVAHIPGAPITIEYAVTATKNFVAQPWLDSSHAYIAPAGIFLYPDGQLQQPVTVTIQPVKQWSHVTTGLTPVANRANTYTADNFDILYDSPILIGNLDSLPAFAVDGIPHYFTGWHLGTFDKSQLRTDLQKLVTAATHIIGDIPYQHYSFIAIGPGRGGIEHLNSTTISFSGEALSTAAGREQVLSFIAHEYFHHYNVKRIRPVALGPFDYNQANKTNLLWVSEGLTVYYEYLVLKRAGLINSESLLHNFQSLIAAYENKSGHLHQSLAQASEATWFDGPFGRSPDSTISYYQKGPAIGLLLDLAIRHATGNQQSLDDVMRKLYREYYQEKKRGFTDAEFRQTCESIAGTSLPEIFDYVYTVKASDYAKYLAYAGFTIDTIPHTENGVTTRSFQIQPDATANQQQLAIRKSWLGE